MTDLPARRDPPRKAALLVSAACTLALCLTLPAAMGVQATRRPAVLPVPYGLSRVPLTHDGVRALLVRARRDNFKAHGFDVLTIYALSSPPTQKASPFLVVSVWDKDKEHLEVTAGGGAHCLLHDFRLVGGPGQDLQLVIAQRDFGRSYADQGQVTFTRYELRHNTREPGRPAYYFESGQSFKARRKYCDVDQAFRQELGLRSR